MVALHSRERELMFLGNPFQVSIPMNIPPILRGFSCISEPAVLSSGDRALRSCPFVSCHPTAGF